MTIHHHARSEPDTAFSDMPQPEFPVPGPNASGLNDLVVRALERLKRESGAGAVSEEARRCMQSPVATALACALCDDASDLADLMVADLIDAGVSVEEVCLDHLAPAARCLGDWWESDRLPFMEVTMATSRIQSLLRRMPANRDGAGAPGEKGAIFCAVPGEQHTLGVMMAADMFRRVGWDVALMVGQSHDEIMDRVRRHDRLVIGLSCSGDHSFAALKRVMTSIRRNRPEAHVMVSGHITAAPARLADLPQPFEVIVDQAAAKQTMQRLQATIAAPAAQRHRTSV